VEQIRNLVDRATNAPTRDERIAAYGQLVDRFRDMACGYAYSMLGDFHLAEDAAQEAFITAFGKLEQLRQPEAFPGWFRRIVFSACGRIQRRENLPAASIDAAADVPAVAADPAGIAEDNEMKNEVLQAIRQLPDEQREATMLFYINGYSQRDISEFLEVPVHTVKNRLHASRMRLKERMLTMVKDTLHTNAPNERFNLAIIDELLARPRPMEIEGHPVRQIWNIIRSELSEYEVVYGDEIEDKQTSKAAEDHAFEEHAYRLSSDKALRFQTTTVTMAAIPGRTPPVRLLTAGRVFRPTKGNKFFVNVFHQMDGLCIDKGLDVEAFKKTSERLLLTVVPGGTVRWIDADFFHFVVPGFEAHLQKDGREMEVLGGGMLKGDTLQRNGFDPKEVQGFSWGIGMERLAMLRFGIDDIRQLWQPPYVPG
jgi:RNA polymerase sigma factor (sigma-70 family)